MEAWPCIRRSPRRSARLPWRPRLWMMLIAGICLLGQVLLMMNEVHLAKVIDPRNSQYDRLFHVFLPGTLR